MSVYLGSLGVVLLFAVLVILCIKYINLPSEDYRVEIIIDGGTSPENLEMLVRSAKILTERHMPGAKIYIQGGNSKEIDIICRYFDIERKV